MDQLTEKQIQHFINEGFVKLENVFSQAIADECRDILWKEITCDPNNPETWTQPVIRIGALIHRSFREAANSKLLHNAFDQLAGKGNWMPVETMGSFPIRFPSNLKANDTGWHVDASFPAENESHFSDWRININSKGRALLMLFLFSDVTGKDAPTRIRSASHFDVAKILKPEGEKGLSFMELAQKLNATTSRKEIWATGKAGSVYLCHPFIVHAAQDHKGVNPKFMAQPPLLTARDFNLDQTDNNLSPVEKAILKGLQA